MIKKLTFTTLSLLAGFSFASQSQAATTYYYDRNGNPGWSSATGWGTSSVNGPFNTGWVDGSVAHTGSASTVTINVT